MVMEENESLQLSHTFLSQTVFEETKRMCRKLKYNDRREMYIAFFVRRLSKNSLRDVV